MPFVREGADRNKDQSYFLYATEHAQLERLIFPLGESTKSQVRAEAVARRLPGATKGESQELCFVGAGQGAYASFVSDRANGRVRPGPIVDADGRVVGTHNGIHRFTVGQRKGLGVALGKPAFVTSIDPNTATVRLGNIHELTKQGAQTSHVSDVVLAPGVSLPFDARVRVRYRHEGVLARVHASDDGASSATIVFAHPVKAVSRGQIAVFYDGERVLGGGRLC
jgi:tRNA-specific 2-thiouridylase